LKINYVSANIVLSVIRIGAHLQQSLCQPFIAFKCGLIQKVHTRVIQTVDANISISDLIQCFVRFAYKIKLIKFFHFEATCLNKFEYFGLVGGQHAGGNILITNGRRKTIYWDLVAIETLRGSSSHCSFVIQLEFSISKRMTHFLIVTNYKS
jgi:hypothetical protein